MTTDAPLDIPHILEEHRKWRMDKGGERRDGYRFVGWVKAGALMIRAGCRNMTVAEYRDHNAQRGDVQMRDETASILDHIERVARVRVLIVEAAQ